MAETTATTSANLRAFHGDPVVKARYLARLKEHHRQGQIVHGDKQTDIILEDGTFCDGSIVWWTTHSNDCLSYVRELGIPRSLAWLEETIFKNISATAASQFGVDFLEVIPVGADLSLVVAQFLHWLLMDKEEGVMRFAETDRAEVAIQNVGELLSRFLSGETITIERWKSAKTATILAGTKSPAVNIACWASSGTAHTGVDSVHFDTEAACAAGGTAYAYGSNFVHHAKVDVAAREITAAKQAAKLLQLLREALVPK